ncbi:hypothetical protein [Endozoicomonas arenosclerae]|uniref:hypothetical protein n=1 Tax=Endozoicomonas arenosclerae TaxID=1633495 RepID=UPI000781573C|nr:hypothetical protein [Endozoicomonas arenosclerae]
MTISGSPPPSSPRKSGHVNKKQSPKQAVRQLSPASLLKTDPDLMVDRSPRPLKNRKVQSGLKRALDEAMTDFPELLSSTKWHPKLKLNDLKTIDKHCQEVRDQTRPLKLDCLEKCSYYSSCQWNEEFPDQAEVDAYFENLDIIAKTIHANKVANSEELALTVAIHLMSEDVPGVCLADVVDNGSDEVTADHALVLVGAKPEDVELGKHLRFSDLPDHVLVVDRWLGVTCSPKDYFSERSRVMEEWEKAEVPVLTFYESKPSEYVSPLSKDNELPEDSIFSVMPLSLDCYGIDLGDDDL